jgi:hypothetical protein
MILEIIRMIGSYQFKLPYAIEVEKAKSAIEIHTNTIGFLKESIVQKQKSIQKREKLLEIARNRLEIAEKMLKPMEK